jgi:hypothetical protein
MTHFPPAVSAAIAHTKQLQNPTMEQQEPWSFWDRTKAAFLGVGPDGRITPESAGRQMQFQEGLGQIGAGLGMMGGPSNTRSLPSPYSGPGIQVPLQGEGLQALIAQILGGRI